MRQEPVAHYRIALQQCDLARRTFQNVAALLRKAEYGLNGGELLVDRHAPDVTFILAPVDIISNATRRDIRRERLAAQKRQDVVVQIIGLLDEPTRRLMPLDISEVLISKLPQGHRDNVLYFLVPRPEAALFPLLEQNLGLGRPDRAQRFVCPSAARFLKPYVITARSYAL